MKTKWFLIGALSVGLVLALGGCETPELEKTVVVRETVEVEVEVAEPTEPAWSLTGNSDTTPGDHFLGTTDDQALELHVNGSRALRLEPNDSPPNVIGGYKENRVTGGAVGAAIGGGGNYGGFHVVSDDYGTVGGGYGNLAGDNAGTASDASRATVGGGMTNKAMGEYATVPGGYLNTAKGRCSFAAGCRAQANESGCFVWGDQSTDQSTLDFVECNTANRWVARASGGVFFYTNSGLTSGVKVTAGGSAWSSVSDRNLKGSFQELDYVALVERLVAEVPITTWSYDSQDPSIRHIGPMAQDFYAAFGLGEDDLHISTVDADGVALAAIHGLYAHIQALKGENAALRGRVGDLEARLAVLEALLTAMPPNATERGP